MRLVCIREDFRVNPENADHRDLKLAPGHDEILTEEINNFGAVTMQCMGTEPAQRVRKNTPLTETPETGTCCCLSETRKGPIKAEQLQTNFPFVSPLQTVRAPDTELSPIIEHVLIPEQAGFRLGKSCTAQLLNLTQHNYYIEDDFETGKITCL